MVKDSGASSRPDQLRTLNTPRSIAIRTQDDRPVAIVEKSGEQTVIQIQDTWIVQDEWWRQEIHRQYYSVLLDNGTLHTVYHDRIANAWYEQSY